MHEEPLVLATWSLGENRPRARDAASHIVSDFLRIVKMGWQACYSAAEVALVGNERWGLAMLNQLSCVVIVFERATDSRFKSNEAM